MKNSSYRNNAFRIIVGLLTIHPVSAMPLPETPKMVIHGTVVDWIWRGEINYQEQTEGLAKQYRIPSHYVIRLKIEKERNNPLDTVNLYSKFLSIGTGIVSDDLKNDEVIIYFPSRRLEGMKFGVELLIKDYSISADDRGPQAKSSKVLINGQVPKDLGPAFKEELMPVAPKIDEARQAGADQPDTKPVGKPPVKTKPSTPTQEAGPR